MYLQALTAQFQPLSRALDSVKAAEAMQVVISERPSVAVDDLETSETIGDTGDKTGDVTDALAAEMGALEKKQLVEKLNKQATRDRATSMRNVFLANAAGASIIMQVRGNQSVCNV